jgi:hypothetical protein
LITVEAFQSGFCCAAEGGESQWNGLSETKTYYNPRKINTYLIGHFEKWSETHLQSCTLCRSDVQACSVKASTPLCVKPEVATTHGRRIPAQLGNFKKGVKIIHRISFAVAVCKQTQRLR